MPYNVQGWTRQKCEEPGVQPGSPAWVAGTQATTSCLPECTLKGSWNWEHSGLEPSHSKKGCRHAKLCLNHCAKCPPSLWLNLSIHDHKLNSDLLKVQQRDLWWDYHWAWASLLQNIGWTLSMEPLQESVLPAFWALGPWELAGVCFLRSCTFRCLSLLPTLTRSWCELPCTTQLSSPRLFWIQARSTGNPSSTSYPMWLSPEDAQRWDSFRDVSQEH